MCVNTTYTAATEQSPIINLTVATVMLPLPPPSANLARCLVWLLSARFGVLPILNPSDPVLGAARIIICIADLSCVAFLPFLVAFFLKKQEKMTSTASWSRSPPDFGNLTTYYESIDDWGSGGRIIFFSESGRLLPIGMWWKTRCSV